MFKRSGRLHDVFKGLSWTDRLLPLLIIISMIVGIVISVYAPSAREKFHSNVQFVGVSIPLAVGMIIMMIPPLCKVEWESIHKIARNRDVYIHIGISLLINWIICPFMMLGLSWMALFDHEEYRVGVIMIGIARCIAMVLIWNELADGNNTLCIIIVMVNSLLQIVLYAPLQIFLCYVISGTPRAGGIEYSVVAKSVAAFLGVPLGLGVLIRLVCVWTLGLDVYSKRVLPFISPWSLIGLLYTIVVIFIERGDDFIKHIGEAVLCIIPLVVYFLLAWFGTFVFMRWVTHRTFLSSTPKGQRSKGSCSCEKVSLATDDSEEDTHTRWKQWGCANYGDTTTQAFVAASNNFELSLSVSISIYGSGSKQAIAATFGPLLEVPILLALTFVAKVLRSKFEWSDVADTESDEESCNDPMNSIENSSASP